MTADRQPPDPSASPQSRGAERPSKSGTSLDAVRAVERALAERADHRTGAESSLVAARATADTILAQAREQGLAEAAALHAQRLADAERRAAATVADAHARAEREAAALLRHRSELTAELLARVLPATGDVPGDARAEVAELMAELLASAPPTAEESPGDPGARGG